MCFLSFIISKDSNIKKTRKQHRTVKNFRVYLWVKYPSSRNITTINSSVPWSYFLMFSIVQRTVGLMFDLHGVLKNWINCQHLETGKSPTKNLETWPLLKKYLFKCLVILGPQWQSVGGAEKWGVLSNSPVTTSTHTSGQRPSGKCPARPRSCVGWGLLAKFPQSTPHLWDSQFPTGKEVSAHGERNSTGS